MAMHGFHQEEHSNSGKIKGNTQANMDIAI